VARGWTCGNAGKFLPQQGTASFHHHFRVAAPQNKQGVETNNSEQKDGISDQPLRSHELTCDTRVILRDRTLIQREKRAGRPSCWCIYHHAGVVTWRSVLHALPLLPAVVEWRRIMLRRFWMRVCQTHGVVHSEGTRALQSWTTRWQTWRSILKRPPWAWGRFDKDSKPCAPHHLSNPRPKSIR